jgi:hypothetical protein
MANINVQIAYLQKLIKRAETLITELETLKAENVSETITGNGSNSEFELSLANIDPSSVVTLKDSSGATVLADYVINPTTKKATVKFGSNLESGQTFTATVIKKRGT